jgi:hypothetical protein
VLGYFGSYKLRIRNLVEVFLIWLLVFIYLKVLCWVLFILVIFIMVWDENLLHIPPIFGLTGKLKIRIPAVLLTCMCAMMLNHESTGTGNAKRVNEVG